jgi:Concanavalin A-like lectin/glucanases superfamily
VNEAYLAGWTPAPRWAQQGSYSEPTAIPSTQPGDAPLVCLQVNASWLPLLAGCAMQLMQPTTWASADPAAVLAALQAAGDLCALVGNAGACPVITFRFVACGLQFSVDSGTTWNEVPGWDTFAPGCFTGATGPTGPAGAAGVTPELRYDGCALQVSTDGGATWSDLAGWSIPALQGCLSGTPAVPPGVSPLQAACNIANWLAVEILQGSMSSLAGSLAASATTLEAALGLFGLAAGWSGVGALVFEAAGIFVAAGTAIGETALNTAAGDATLRADITCAIFTAISSDGYVTPGNVATIVSNIGAITYATPGIVGLIQTYVSNLGYVGLNAIQSEGALYAGSCAGCGGTPIPGGTNCAVFNGTDDYLGAAFVDIGSDTAGYTWCAWVYLTTSAYAAILSNFGSDATTRQFYGRFDAPETVRGERGSGDAFHARAYTANSTLSLGAWHHVAQSWDPGGTNSASLYIDGVTVAQTFHGSDHPGLVMAAQLLVGALDLEPGPIELLEGKMADLRIYGAELSDPQIAAIYAGGVTGYVPEGAPLGWWPFNDGSGSTAANYGSAASVLTWHGTGAHWGTI